MKKRLFSISSEPVTVYPDREHQPDYRVIHNKIHVSITVETKAPFRIRIGNAVLKDKNGNDLSPRNGKNTSIKYPVLLTNSSEINYYFESDGYELLDGASFIIDVSDQDYDEIERYTFSLRNGLWSLINFQKRPCQRGLRRSLNASKENLKI